MWWIGSPTLSTIEASRSRGARCRSDTAYAYELNMTYFGGYNQFKEEDSAAMDNNEHLTDSSEAQIRVSMIQLMLRRLTGAKYRDRFR